MSTAKRDNTKTELKPVDPKDFFGSSKVKCVKKEEAKKRKVPEEELHDDPDFSALLKSVDDDMKVKPSPSKKAKREPSPQTKLRNDRKFSPSPAKSVRSPKEKENGQKSVKQENDVKNVNGTKKENGIKKENGTKKEPLEKEKKKAVDSPKKDKDNRKEAKKGDEAKDKNKANVNSKMDKEVVQNPAKPKKEIESPSKAVLSKRTVEDTPLESQLWVDKYKPTTLKGIIGQQGDKSNMKKLITWLRNWPKNNLHNNGKRAPKPPPFQSHSDDGSWAKAALLSGPPGVGKTTTSYLVAKELGLDIMELNASDTRSKKMLDNCLSDAMSNTSLSKTSKNRVLLMDEVDGMAGNEDRGGMAELIQLIKNSKVPVICMCNDRNHQKIRSLANYCFDLRFQRPRAEQIKAAMMSICFREKIKIAPNVLLDLITGCNQDVRQVLHHLSMMKAKSDQFTEEDSKKEAESSKKTSIKQGPWDVVRKVFSKAEHSNMSIMDKSDLFFHDYSLGPLFVQENYLLCVPDGADYDRKSTMVLASKAADSICMGDLVEKTIRSQNAWSLLPTEAIFASVIPGEYMAGHVAGQIQFPRWLGQYSRQNKFDRILQELQMHTRLSAGLSKSSLNRDFVQHLRNNILRPMKKNGADGVADSVRAMEFYSLMREDLDNLLEITTWPDQPDPMRNIESKVKAAFTRSYNKDVVLPYAKVANVAKKAKVDATPFGEDNGDEEESKSDDDTIEGDAMIKAKKPSSKKPSTAAKKAAPVKKADAGNKGKGRGKKSK